MFKVAVAHSLELDSAEAAAELLDQCRRQLGGLRPQAGIIFAGIDHEFPVILKKIKSVYPEMELIGGTTDGEFSSVHGYTDDSIVLTAFYSDELVFKAGLAENIFQDTVNTVRKGVESAVSGLGGHPALCITMPSGLTPAHTAVNGDNMLDGMRLVLGNNFPVFGGTAGDAWRLEGTFQFYNDSVFADALPFLLITGPVLYSFGVGTGRIPIGPKERITKSHGNTVHEIGNSPALEFYKHYLGEDIRIEDTIFITEYPLAIYEDDSDRFYIRAATIADGDFENGILTFGGNVPENALVQITHSTRDGTVKAAGKSVTASRRDYPGTEPAVVLCFSCAGRKQLLGTRIKEEYLAFKNSYPGLPVAGFYSYGEIAPLGRNRPARFHNETLVNLMMGLK